MRLKYNYPTMGYSHLTLDVADDGIALITFNRPQKLNALNAATLAELDDALARCDSGDVRALILTGAGEKAFVAGADIGELPTDSPMALELAQRGQRVFRHLELMRKPSIAAVNGFALGGGLELAMACTMRVAAETAKLGQPEVKLGIICGYAGTQRLPRLVGRGKAMEMLLTGEPIDAAEAYRIGLVNHVVAADAVVSFSRELLHKVLANAALAIGMTMDAVDVGLSSGFEEGSRFEAAAFAVAAGTPEARARIRTFLEKRAAK
jgi:enoyl-CoA hydratase